MSLGKPLQWDIFFLHLNELPSRPVFLELDDRTKWSDKFVWTISSKLNLSVFEWGIIKFKPIPCVGFFISFDNPTIDNLSTDQYYTYCIC